MVKNLVKNATKMLLIPTLILGGLSACGYSNGTRTQSYDGTRTNNYTGTGHGYNVNNYDGMGVRNLDGTRNYGPNTFGTNNYGTYNNNRLGTNNFRPAQQVASRAAAAADRVPGVSKATAIVQGNDIVVGIDVAGNKTAHEKRSLENQVQNVIQNQDRGFKVHVTSDSKLHSRIQQVYRSMNTNNGFNTNGTNGFNNNGTNGFNTTGTNGFNNNGLNYNTTNPVTPGHPVRDMGADVTNIIRDIGRTATAPFR